MVKIKDIIGESTSVLSEIESQLGKVLLEKKKEIEREFEEKVRQEREEVKKKLEKIDEDFGKEKETLHAYKEEIAGYENRGIELQALIREHLQKALSYQTDIEKLAGLTLAELRKVSDLTHELEGIRQAADEKMVLFKKTLEEKFGILAEVPERKDEEEFPLDLEHELSKLKKIKELLGPEEGGGVEEAAEEPETGTIPPGLEKEGEPGVEISEINDVIESSLAGEEETVREEAEKEEEAEAAMPGKDYGFNSIFEKLDKYRKSESNGMSGEINYFESEEKMILDAESLLSTMQSTVEEAKKLYLKLDQTESPKDQFFIKQEIITLQELLRKLILRCVRMCEKESCVLPGYTLDILNPKVLKDILEKLSMENWSNQDHFSSFHVYIESMKKAFYAKITPPDVYLQSIIEELGV